MFYNRLLVLRFPSVQRVGRGKTKCKKINVSTIVKVVEQKSEEGDDDGDMVFPGDKECFWRCSTICIVARWLFAILNENDAKGIRKTGKNYPSHQRLSPSTTSPQPRSHYTWIIKLQRLLDFIVIVILYIIIILFVISGCRLPREMSLNE